MNPGRRVSKSPQARRKEMMDAAEQLFGTKGYDETAVSDIVRELGVAQGTFYYHFESKEALRDAIAERVADEITREVDAVTEDGRMDAPAKLLAIYGIFAKVMRGRERLSEHLHEARNAAVHERIERRISPHLAGALERIVREGNRAGVFDAPHPRETAKALLGFSAEMGDPRHDHTDLSHVDPRVMARYLDVASRILGADPAVLRRRLAKEARE